MVRPIASLDAQEASLLGWSRRMGNSRPDRQFATKLVVGVPNVTAEQSSVDRRASLTGLLEIAEDIARGHSGRVKVVEMPERHLQRMENTVMLSDLRRTRPDG